MGRIFQVKIIIAVMVLLVSSQALVQGARVSPSQYFVTSPATFRGVDVFDPLPSGCFTDTGGYACVFGVAPLIDGDTASQTVDLTSPEYIWSFNPWNRTQDPTYFLFTFDTEVTVATIGLSFLNYPSENISLPNLRVFEAMNAFSGTGGTIIPYTLRGNGELSTDDQEVVTVYLDLFPAEGVHLRYTRIEISFSGLSNTDWFLLSEVTFDSSRNDTWLPTIFLSQQDTSPQGYEGDILQLTCTVTVDGLFEWEWKKDDQMLTENDQIQSALGTRASALTLTNVCGNNSGNYTCEVQHVGAVITKRSMTMAVTIPSGLRVQIDCQTIGILGSSIILICIVRGYDGDVNDITWMSKGNPDASLTKRSKYRIDRFSRNICSSMSVSVTLTIHNLVSGNAGGYICSVASGIQVNTTLTILDPRLWIPVCPTETLTFISATPTFNGSGGSSCSSSSSDINITTIAAGVSVILVALTASVAAHILLFTYQTRRKRTASQKVSSAAQSGQNTDLTDATVGGPVDSAEVHHLSAAIATESNEAYGQALTGDTHTEQVTTLIEEGACMYVTVDSAGLDDRHTAITANPTELYETVVPVV